ncbi:MAG: PPC domain-containing protein [Planctomycetes bacterium]|nr:PPC domain-containing protein [Planctomycetota bacterium]
MTRKIVAMALMIFLCLQNTLYAELPLIRLDRITPLGGLAGSDVTLEIAGRDLEDAKTLHFDHPGLKATWLKDRYFKLSIAADVPAGTYEVRAVGRFGISGARLFSVQRGLIEVDEKEPNDEPATAQVVPMNCAINAMSDNNGDDYFCFSAKKGQRVTIDCFAYRLDSQMTPMMTLSMVRPLTPDPSPPEGRGGKELMQSKPYHHRTDPFLDFVAPADGDYLVGVHDMTYRGGRPYRLVISTLPHIESAFPMAIVPGEKAALTLLGRNLPGGKATAWKIHDNGLEQLTLAPAPYGSRLADGRLADGRLADGRLADTFAFSRHMPSPSLNARGTQVWPIANALTPITLAYADAPITLDKEPNDTAETAQPITLPTVICGRFDKPGDADWYRFTAKKGDAFAVDLLCERLELPGDPFVLVFDSKGNEIAAFDDHGINFNALAQANRDPLGVLRIPADGEYKLFVQERYRNGGARYQYVLKITPVEPDFYPVVVHETPNEPSCPCVRQGGSAFYEVCLNRRNHAGPVVIEAEGLPAGVTCKPVHVSSQSQFANVVFTAAVDAPEWAGAIRLKAWAIVDGKKIEREVRPVQRRWAIANINTSVMLRQTCLAVCGRAPYGVQLPSEKLAVAAGASFETTAKVIRQWPDFKAKVQLVGLNLPPGFSFAAADIPADQTEAKIKLTVAANVPPGDYSIVLRTDAQGPYSRDPMATARPNVRVADPTTPMLLQVLPKAPTK